MGLGQPDWDRPWNASFEQWQWQVVQVEEILRFIGFRDESHDRLAFILLDNLVEVILDRDINPRLKHQADDALVEEFAAHMDDPELPEILRQMVREHVSHEERTRISKHFHEKCRYLRRHGLLSSPEHELLLRLHEYRNEIYHNDRVQTHLLGDLVLAYQLLASQLLIRHTLPIGGYAIASSHPESTWFVWSAKKLGERLVEDATVDLPSIASRLRDHIKDRINNVKKGVGAARLMLFLHDEEGVGKNNKDWIMSMVRSLNETTPNQLESWDRRAEKLTAKRSGLTPLLIQYINLDRDVARPEPEVRRLWAMMEYVRQDIEDERRGK